MKIAILSDFHLGYERFRDDAYVQAKEAVEKAAGLADMLIMPGDLFDFRHPKPEVIAEAINVFRDLSSREFKARVVSFEGAGKRYTDKPIIVIPGTHERRSEQDVDSVDLLMLAGLAVSVNRAKAVVEKDGERVAVFGVGGVADERFRGALEQAAFKPEKGAFNILMFHQTLYELLPFSETFMHIEELPAGFDLYVDGHIHSKFIGSCHGKPFLIPGSTVLTQLRKEEQEEKGFFVFDTKDSSYEFHKIKCRQFKFLKIDITGSDPGVVREKVEKEINAALDDFTGEKPVVRVELTGTMKRGFKSYDLDMAGIAKSFSEATVEMGKDRIEKVDEDLEVQAVRAGLLENVSIRDYGLSVFLEKLKNNYSLKLSPSQLFDILSAEGKKDAVLNKALEELFAK